MMKQTSLVLLILFATFSKLHATTLFSSKFRSNAEGFAYNDNVFRTTSAGKYASGAYRSHDNGFLEVKLGGVDHHHIRDISGGWVRDFTLPHDANITIQINFDLFMSSRYEKDEFAEALCSIDGVLIGDTSQRDYIGQTYGGQPGISSKWVTVRSGILKAGQHRLAIGGYNNKKTEMLEYTTIRFGWVILDYSQADTKMPTRSPTKLTKAPSKRPTKAPTKTPIRVLTKPPSKAPTKAPTKRPTNVPTKAPVRLLTKPPTKAPTKAPVKPPTKAPTDAPTKAPVRILTKPPTKEPTKSPLKPLTKAPTDAPTKSPVKPPTIAPTKAPTKAPVKPLTKAPTDAPIKAPVKPLTQAPTDAPTKSPVKPPTKAPTDTPTKSPVKPLTNAPTKAPTKAPVKPLTKAPTDAPTKAPVKPLTQAPTDAPTKSPVTPLTKAPTDQPTKSPVKTLTLQPTKSPSTAATKSPSQAPLTKMPIMSPITSDLFITRINVGSADTYVDPDGAVWEADKYFEGKGGTYSQCPTAIEGTAADDLYCKERFYNVFAEPQPYRYVIPVPRQSGYTVKLHFAEVFFTKEGERVFDVTVNGRPAATKLDIFKRAGGSNTALIIPFTTMIRDDNVIIEFLPLKENPKICAIEVIEAPDFIEPPTSAPVAQAFSMLINCGGNNFVEKVGGRRWVADQFFIGGNPYADGSFPIENSLDFNLYQTERFGEFQYEIPVPATGSYEVILHFAELFWQGRGQRLFNIDVEGIATFTDVDIVALGGGKNLQAVTLESIIDVTDGFVSITLSNAIPRVDNPKLSGIEINAIP